MVDKKTPKTVTFSNGHMAFVNFFALREIITELAAAKGQDGDAWKQSLGERVSAEIASFVQKPGGSFAIAEHEAVQMLIRTLLAAPKRH